MIANQATATDWQRRWAEACGIVIPPAPATPTPAPYVTPTPTKAGNRMAFSPTPVEITDRNSTDDFKRMTRGIVDVGIGTSDYLSNHAIDLHPRIVNLLRVSGVDGQAGLFGRGSIAENHAKAVYGILQKAASSAEAVAKLMQAAEVAWQVHVVAPVRQAEAERNRAGRTLHV